MSLLDLFRGRHLNPSIEEGGAVRFDYVSCAAKDKLANAHHTRTVEVIDKAGVAHDVEEIIDCYTAQAELTELRLQVQSLSTELRGQRVLTSDLEALVAHMRRVQSKAILVALNAGRQIAEKLNVSPDWPIDPKVADNGKAVQVDLPGVTLLFGIFDEELIVHLNGTTEVVTYRMRDGEITNEIADSILGKLTRAGWDGDKSLPATVSLTGVTADDDA